MNALEVQGLNTFYGKSHILHDVALTVAEGSITTLLGRNGAGKTTTLRSLVGLTPARAGSVRIFGQDTTRLPTFRIAALGVGYVPEGRRIFATCRSMRTCTCRSSGQDRGRSIASISYFRGWPNANKIAAGSSPAASRKCCRSPAPCC